jgi:MFS family permease
MKTQFTGMRAFVVFWLGQVLSLLGTQMSGFGLTIWAYKVSGGSATALALVGFFFLTPLLLLSPVAGALVDRSNRKIMMMLSDLASGLATVVVLLLFVSGRLEIWHLYITSAVSGAFQAFQWPAFSAAITLMLPKEQYGRANGMMGLAESGSGILSPILAGALLGTIGLTGLLLIDVVTFSFAVLSLLFIHVPQPEQTAEGQAGRGSLLKESLYGFHYILKRPSLLGLQLIFLSSNLVSTIAFTLRAPMILARTGNNELIFGSVNSIAAVGGVVGGLAMSAWGGFKRQVHGVLLGWALMGLVGTTLLGFGQELVIWSVASFLGSFLGPIINASNQSIWQTKVAPDVQGRVFAIRRLIAWLVTPLATLIAGPLADFVMEPAMQANGSLSDVFGGWVGVGPGAGMSLVFVFSGLAITAIGLSGYLIPVVRDAEILIPDHAAVAQPASNEN